MEEKEVLTTQPESIHQEPQRATETAPEQPEKEERLFTQAEVNAIIKKRLSKLEAQHTATSESEAAELAKREARLNCREYLLDKGYSAELLDILGTDDFEAFKQKAEAIYKTVSAPISYPSLKDAGEVRKISDPRDEIASIFKGKNAHTPKDKTGVY